MEFMIQMPENVAEDGYVTERWKSISRSFIERSRDNFGATNQMRLQLLTDLAGREFEQLMNSFSSPVANVSEVCFKLMQMIEFVCIPKVLLLYERHKYFLIRQQETETFEHFFNRLELQADECEFGLMRNPLLVESIRAGVLDWHLRQRVSNMYDLQSILAMCRNVPQNQERLANNVPQDPVGFDNHTEEFKAIPPQAPTSSEAQETGNKSNINGDEEKAEEIESSDSQTDWDNVLKIIERCTANSEKSYKTRIVDDGGVKRMIINIQGKDVSVKRHDTLGGWEIQNEDESYGNDIFKSQKKIGRLGKEKFGKRIQAAIQRKARPSSYRSNTIPLKCPKCDDVFPRRRALQKHLTLVHKAVKVSYKCKWCGQSNFRSDYTLREHVCLHHTKEKPFLCDLCNGTFTHYKNLQDHLEKHAIGKNSLCTICGKLLSGSASLMSHMKKHTAFRSCVCKFCGKAFRINHSLKIHMRTHTGEKPFICEECGKSFATKLTLTLHQRTHSGEKPYKCFACDYRCGHVSHMKLHERIHTKEKPFICHICGRAFKSSGQRNCHMSSHTGECHFECHLCDKRYRYRSGLKGHLKRRHPEAGKKDGELTGSAPAEAQKKQINYNQTNVMTPNLPLPDAHKKRVNFNKLNQMTSNLPDAHNKLVQFNQPNMMTGTLPPDAHNNVNLVNFNQANQMAPNLPAPDAHNRLVNFNPGTPSFPYVSFF